MKTRAKYVVARLLLLLLAASFSLAPDNNAAAQDAPVFTQQELDQMLAPIALYPDSLLSQILMAATYPLEVVEAERWSAANPRLNGDRAVRAVERNNWDPSVKSLVAFPQILRMMSDKLDWTERLGDAFLDQETQVMDTIQDLRQRAYAAGNLRSNGYYEVRSQGGYIDIEETNPDIAYLPYYDPTAVYGPWRSPQYPPVYWAPWPGYRERAGFGTGFAWGAGITLGAEFFFGAFDWRQRHVNVINVNNYYYPRNTSVASRAPVAWQHDPAHRRGAPYREAAVREKFRPVAAAPDARRDYRGHQPTAAEQRGANDNRPAARSSPGARPEERNGTRPTAAAPAMRPDARENRAYRPEGRPGPQPAAAAPVTRPDTREVRVNRPEQRAAPQPAAAASAARPDPRAGRASRPNVEQPPHALEGVGRGAETRTASERGRASSAPAPRPPERAAAPPPPRAAAAPPPPPRVAAAPPPPRVTAAPPPPPHVAPAPAPPQPAAAPRPPEKAREEKGK